MSEHKFVIKNAKNNNPTIKINYAKSQAQINIRSLYSGGGGGVENHSQLLNLDYKSSGHTGFQEELVAGQYINIQGNIISLDLDSFYQVNNEVFLSSQNQKSFVLSRKADKKENILSVNINNHNILTNRYELKNDGYTLELYDGLDKGCEVGIVYLGAPLIATDAVLTNCYKHYQKTESTEISIEHNLGRFPQVTIVDSDGIIIESEIQYLDEFNIKISFNNVFSGHVYLI